jgi:hypothetical protein
MKNNCPHCEFIERLGLYLQGCKDSTPREYWLLTEIFVYLHGGKDYCNVENRIMTVREGNMKKVGWTIYYILFALFGKRVNGIFKFFHLLD